MDTSALCDDAINASASADPSPIWFVVLLGFTADGQAHIGPRRKFICLRIFVQLACGDHSGQPQK